MLEDLLTIEHDWETEEEFIEYVSTLNELSNYDKAVQKNKFTHSTRYVRELLITQFKRWTKDLLLLSLFSNQPTASLVAKLLKGQNTTRVTSEVFDTYTQMINQERFITFLNTHVKKTQSCKKDIYFCYNIILTY